MAKPPNKSGKSLSAGENFAHPLYQLIGAPLLALIQAETQAARATADFIENIGFEPDPEQKADEIEDGALGSMRMAKFSNKMQGADGKVRAMDVSVPLLSLVPVPALQIKDAELEFYVKILDFSKEQTANQFSHNSRYQKAITNEAKKEENSSKPKSSQVNSEQDFLSPNRMQFRASMGRGPSGNQHQSSMESQVRIKINMTQADLPVGLSKLFNIMDQSITLEPSDKEKE